MTRFGGAKHLEIGTSIVSLSLNPLLAGVRFFAAALAAAAVVAQYRMALLKGPDPVK